MKGLIAGTADFIARSMLRKGSAVGPMTVPAIDFLQTISETQERNDALVVLLYANDGAWVTFNGLRLLIVIPGQKYFRIIIPTSRNEETTKLLAVLDHLQRSGNAVPAHQKAYAQWRLDGEGLSKIASYIDDLPELSAMTADKRSRHFSGLVRQAALEAFVNRGRWCPGVAPMHPKHKLSKNDRIEFDHVLPHAKGGSNSLRNCQVLCERCNRHKSATAR